MLERNSKTRYLYAKVLYHLDEQKYTISSNPIIQNLGEQCYISVMQLIKVVSK